MPPKFQVTIPKCSRCNLSVYPMEQATYDNRLFHQSCFKCLECKSALSLSRIACINNDLYCKTCFMRIFTKDGKYASFGGAAAEARRATVSGPAPGPSSSLSPSSDSESSSSSSSSSVTPLHHRTMTATPTSNLIASRTASLSVYGRPSEASSSPPPSSTGSTSTSTDPILSSLFEAITSRNVEKAREIVNSNGVELLFKFNNRGQTPIEAAFSGFNNAKNVGNMFLTLLSTKLTGSAMSPSPSGFVSPPLSPTSKREEATSSNADVVSTSA